MRVLKIWDAEYPWDVRAEKVCQALTARGHEVHMVARNRDRRPCVESLPEVMVHRLRPWPLPRSIDAALQFPAFMSPRWLLHTLKAARTIAPAIVLVRDLPLAPMAVAVGRLLDVPVVLDMAENYPAMMRAMWDHGRQRWTDWVVRNPRVVAAVERWVLRHVDHVVVVIEESAERLENLGVSKDRITAVLNTPVRDRLTPGDTNHQSVRGSRPLALVYLGLMELPRGVQVALDAIGILKSQGVDVKLDLIGAGRDLGLLQGQAREQGLSGADVSFHGFLPYQAALRVVATADVGLVPHIANESWNTTIPNKLFDYMSLGLPVITSDAIPAARIVRESQSGVAYRSTDPEDLARAIREFLSTDRRAAAGRAGRTAIESRYNWAWDGEVMVSLLERIAVGRPGS